MDTDLENPFVVRSKAGKTIKFPVYLRGLYVKETVYKDGKYSDISNDDYPGLKTTTHLEEDSDDEDVMPSLEERGDSSDDESDDESEAEAEDFGEVHATEVEGFTQREVERDKKCRKLLHNLSAPS